MVVGSNYLLSRWLNLRITTMEFSVIVYSL
jgi:hypothetical protein